MNDKSDSISPKPNAARHPNTSPIKAPAPPPISIPADIPAKMIDVALATDSDGTKRAPKPRANRPEPAKANAEEHSRNDQDGETWGEHAQKIRGDEHQAEEEENCASITSTYRDRQAWRRDRREQPGYGDHQACGAFADVHSPADVTQQSDRQELGRYKSGCARSDRQNSQPWTCGRRGVWHGRGLGSSLHRVISVAARIVGDMRGRSHSMALTCCCRRDVGRIGGSVCRAPMPASPIQATERHTQCAFRHLALHRSFGRASRRPLALRCAAGNRGACRHGVPSGSRALPRTSRRVAAMRL